jgi:hypothetical protein
MESVEAPSSQRMSCHLTRFASEEEFHELTS